MSKSVSSIAASIAILFAFVSGAACASGNGVVISQIYGGGGNSGAVYKHDYVEIFNASGAAVDISNWSVQYASSAGSNWSGMTTIPANTSLQPGQYYLLQEQAGSGTGTATEPSADPSSGNFNMSGSKGNIALVSNDTGLSGTCPTGGAIVDFVGYGSSACYEGSATATAASDNTEAIIRNGDGCTDNDDNSADFAVGPANPHNSASTTHLCSGGTNIIVSMANVGTKEGNSGTTTLDFTVHLSQPAPAGGVTFDIAATDGTATTADNDYSAIPVNAASIAASASDYTYTVTINGDTSIEPDETFTVTASNFTNTAGFNITSSVTATGYINNDDAVDAAIYKIQGNPTTQGADTASPFTDQLVHTSGIVTAVVPAGGFYVQTADADADSDPLTSNGIFVYDTSDTVIVGDAIDFDAKVSEYHGMTELSYVDNLVNVSHGNPLPTAVEFNTNTPSPDPSALSCGGTNFECYEGMLVHIGNGIVTQAADKYGDVFITTNGKRSLREPGLLFGLGGTAVDNIDNANAGEWDGNPELFKMIPDYFGNVATGTLNGGSRFSGTGVLGYDFGAYVFYPADLSVTYAAPMPRAVPDADPAILRIGEFNAERFCDDVDDRIVPAPPSSVPLTPGQEIVACGQYPQDDTYPKHSPPTTAEYDTKTQRLADYIGTVLDLPDVVALEEVENIGVLIKLANNLNGTYAGPNGVNYVPKLMEGHDIGGIDVGYLVNTARVQISSVQQLDLDLKWHTPHGNDRSVFDHPPLLLQGIFTGAGQSQPFMVMVNHLKARQDVDDVDTNGNSTASALEDQEKRFRQAVAVALQVQSLQRTGSAQSSLQPSMWGFSPQLSTLPTPLIVVGDFNAYQFTDGFADLVGMISGRYDFDANIWDLSDLTQWNLNPVNPPLTDNNLVNPPLWNAVNSLPENEQYSYLYAPSFGNIQGFSPRKLPTDQVLDHALLNTAARANFVRMDYGRADEDATSDAENNSSGAIGVSDHDGFVIQLTFDRIFANGFDISD